MFNDEDREFLVLTNAEDQYSLWPAAKPVPEGWRSVHSGMKGACLEYVEANWLDMRPQSLRKAMAADVQG